MTRTQQAIRAAFTKLVMKRRFDEITVADIAASANVSKSTFYLHFKSKDDVLSIIMEGMLRDLAATASDDFEPARVRGLLSHFWQNRRLGNAVFGGPAASRLRRFLSVMIEDNLRSNRNCVDRGVRPALEAIQIAAGQLSLLQSWLNGEITADADEIVAALRTIAGPR